MKKPSYYAVIFTSIRTEGDHGYSEMAKTMEDLAKTQPGYLGIESAREEIGITVSYWESLEAITNWRKNSEHVLAQSKGIKDWYQNYTVRICKVEREYSWEKSV
ncbi:antibiotic biosynthesis monooxygenase family protein [Maribacter aurantiacus]|uniref:Antibiotic biosynthesis monooxygenase n=1 Tax=Maribacter aurantiacus TaxID=1882343 RepID=A0A5R8MAY2_9FLAO|nr:antibiotic biosynthesis monooxygenase [Maribacter aurantiacus]TLF46677.1 antibiotic biosynthesis monooxygenase [Maribacter aurantiacus]